MNTVRSSLAQLEIEFEERMTMMAKHHQRLLQYAFMERLQQDRAEQHVPHTWYQSLLLQAGTWVQHLVSQDSQDLAQENDPPPLPDEEDVVIVDSQYTVVEVDSSQAADSKQ